MALNGRGMKLDERCLFCGFDGESINHVLFSCSLSRQIWALTGVPSPESGFQNRSVFANIHYLLSNKSNPLWPDVLRKTFPWILWRLWKNRNSAVFEGLSFYPMETAKKVKEDWSEWVEAQIVDDVEVMENPDLLQRGGVIEGRKIWKPPPLSWFKCNIGSSWSKRNKLAGSAWVLRDQDGLVVLHSRRAFANCPNKQEAQFKGLLWAIESMRSHRIDKVIFALQEKELVGAILKPTAWPSFRYQSKEAVFSLRSFKDWKLFLENSCSNRGAMLISQSVTNDCRLQSYVAAGHPTWLRKVFCDERVSAPS